MSVERGGPQLAITSAERCSPRAQLHLQRLLEHSPPRRLRFHTNGGVFSSSPTHETGSVTTRTGPSPMASVSFYEWCYEEQQCLINAEAQARARLNEETLCGSWLEWATQNHQLLQWFVKEHVAARGLLATVLPPLTVLAPSIANDASLSPDKCKTDMESSSLSDIVKRAVLTANDEHIRCTTAMQAVIDIQRRMDSFCAEAMEDRDALVAAIREGEGRYAALMEGSQDAVHASRCAADEADFWEEAATQRDNVLENISRELGALLAEKNTLPRRKALNDTNPGLNNDAVVSEDVDQQASSDEDVDTSVEETPLLASLCGVPACATAVMDGPRKWSLLLSHKLNTITNMYKEAQARSSIYEGFGSGARELAQDFFAAETAVSEALTDTVALLDAKQRHREMLESKLRDAQQSLIAAKDVAKRESAVRDDEVAALWDLLVRSQEEHDARQAEFDAALASFPQKRSQVTQTMATQFSANTTSSPKMIPHDGPVAISLPRSLDVTSVQEAARLPLAQISVSKLTTQEGIFNASFNLQPDVISANAPPRQLYVDIKRKILRIHKPTNNSNAPLYSNGSASSPPTRLRRPSITETSFVSAVNSNDILGVARHSSDAQRLTVMLSSGAPLQLRFYSTFARERAYEYLKILQSTNTVDVVAHLYVSHTAAANTASGDNAPAEDRAVGDLSSNTTTRRSQMIDDKAPSATGEATPARRIVVENSTMTLTTASGESPSSSNGAVTIFHDASHWHDIKIAVVASTVTTDDPVPAELRADANIGQEVDIVVLALTFSTTTHLEDSEPYHGSTEAEHSRSESPGAAAEATIARTTIVSKAIQEALSVKSNSLVTLSSQPSSTFPPTSPKGALSASSSSVWAATAALSRFVVALVNDEEEDTIYFVLARRELIYAIQHLRLTTPHDDRSKASTISLSVSETSIGFVFIKKQNSQDAAPTAGTLALYDTMPATSDTRGALGDYAPGGTDVMSVEPLCQWHFMFVVKPRIAAPSVVLPEGHISHQFLGREAFVTLLHATNVEHRSAFLSSFGQLAASSETVPLHRFTLRTTRSHATVIQPGATSNTVGSDSETVVAYQPRVLHIYSTTLTIEEPAPSVSSPYSPSNIFTTPRSVGSPAVQRRTVSIQLNSVFGGAPLSLELNAVDDEDADQGSLRYYRLTAGVEGPAVFPFLVNCKTCCAEALLTISDRSGESGSWGSASTSLLPLLDGTARAPAARVSAPWYVHGRKLGHITIEGVLL